MTAQPVLARVPQGELIDADRLVPQWPQAIVLFTDQRWHPATILAWCRYRHHARPRSSAGPTAAKTGDGTTRDAFAAPSSTLAGG